jgi:hypothetical protein
VIGFPSWYWQQQLLLGSESSSLPFFGDQEMDERHSNNQDDPR